MIPPAFLGSFLLDSAENWAKSRDLAAWIARPAITGATPFPRAFATDGHGNWVNGAYHSTDGYTWTAADPYLGAHQIVWTGRQFVAAGRWTGGDGTPYVVATSPNGRAWTYRTTAVDGPARQAEGVAADGNTLVVVGYDTADRLNPQPWLIRSTDSGLTWTSESFPALPDPANGIDPPARWKCVARTDKWYAGASGTSTTPDDDFSYGGTLYSSSDGVTWTTVTGSKFFAVDFVTAHAGTQVALVVHHGEGVSGHGAVIAPNYAVSDPPFADVNISPALAVSTDGWASMTPVVSPFDYAWENNGGYAEVAAGSLFDIRWVHDRWFLIGVSNKNNQTDGLWTSPADYTLATSVDGITWTVSADPMTVPPNFLLGIDYGPFGLARLRQFPRDDALGDAPRPGRGSRSVQATTRQGWQGTYR